MIETCKEYVTNRAKDTIWSQERDSVKEKLIHCIQLNHVYKKTYHIVKNQPFLPDQEPFNFSENYVFGKFNSFCLRLKNIIAMFDLIDDYNSLFQRRMEGLLLGEALEEAMQTFEETKSTVVDKKYDYLDQRNTQFDADFKQFLNQIEELKENIGEVIEKNFDSVWETAQGIKFLPKFEKVSEKIPLNKMAEKYDRVLKYCDKEVDRIIKMYKKEKEDPPIPRLFPPIAGRIKWARSLVSHLAELMDNVTTHQVLKTLPATNELTKRYKVAETLLKTYESDMVALWMNQHVWDVDKCLQRNVITICPDKQCLKINMHPTIPLLIRESDLMAKMDLPLPMVALTLFSKQEHFCKFQDTLQYLLDSYISGVSAVKLELRPLLLPHLVKLTSDLQPGLTELTWVSNNWKEYAKDFTESLSKFETLVTRVHDVYTNRIQQTLMAMQQISLHALPDIDDEPWTIEYFLDRNETVCRNAATDLHRKSLMIEEAVEEILNLVRNNPWNADEPFFDGDSCF